MDTSAFWKLVDKARRTSENDAEQQLEELTTLLEALPTEEIVEFHYVFCSFFHASYTWPLWGAADLIGGGCSYAVAYTHRDVYKRQTIGLKCKSQLPRDTNQVFGFESLWSRSPIVHSTAFILCISVSPSSAA